MARPATRVRFGLGALLFGVALAVTACSGPPAGSGAGGKVEDSARVSIENFSFSPSQTRVAPGAKITVVNEDQVTHTLTSTSGKFSTGELAPGASVTFTAPKTPGTYPYICTIHQYMTGSLVVS
jgi:plastocyanin